MRDKWWIGTTALALVASACGGTPNAIPPGDHDSFIEYMDASAPQLLEAHAVPGATVALVRDGVVAWSGAYGVRDTETGERMRPHDVFQVASVSKSVTAYAVMRLVQEGQLELDLPIGRYVTRWRLPDSEYDANAITARRLLSHTGGLSTEGYPGLPPGMQLPTLEESLAGATGAEAAHLVQSPGAGFRYSGGGYTLIQLAVEEVTGRAFADLVAEAVLMPLGMADSTYSQSPPAHAATPSDVDGNALPWLGFSELAAAGLASTAPDLGRFLAAGILDPDPETGLTPDHILALLTPAAATDGTYALGFFIQRPAEGITVVGHAGANPGWRTKILAVPARNAAIVILTNGDGGEAVHIEIGCTWIATIAELLTVQDACP